MRRPNFFYWYFNKSILELLEIWKNILVFSWCFFSVSEMLITLISPWRRDVTVQNWRGLHPIKSLELIIGNIISRLIGAIVRICVIAVGLLFFLINFILGLAVVLFWIGAPLVLVGVLLNLLKGFINPLYEAGLLLAWITISIIFYFRDTETEALNMQFEEILKHPVFERICGRIGISRKRFPDEIVSNQKLMDDFFRLRNMTVEDFMHIVKLELEFQQKKNDAKKFWRWEYLKKITPIGMQWRYGYTIHSDPYCLDLYKGDPTEYSKSALIGRKEEYEVLRLILERPDQNCALIVGDSGIGKKTLVHSLARNIRFGKEKGLENVRILLLDLGRVISESINKGEDVESFLRKIFYEASYAGNVILVIEHLEHFLGKDQGSFHPDISAVIAEFLYIPTFQVIATSTTKEYHHLIEKQDQITKYFEVIELREPSEEETVSVLLSQLEKYENKKVLFTYKSLKEVIKESMRYRSGFPLPQRALDLAMDVLIFWEKKSDEQFVSEKTVADFLTLKTGVQHGEVGIEEQKKLLNLEKDLHQQVIGQEEAISQVSEALRRARSGIGNSNKPVGSFLFLGPTGVGKTETAKALAKIYFGDESRMVRLDMSEFQMPNSIDRLLGSSQLNQPGRLVTQIKDNPYSLLLLDEIEKAYPEALDIFLQILDEGYVNDVFGEKVNFSGTMIIATSNVGAPIIKKMVEQNSPLGEINQAVIDYAIENNIFRAEFLNRFDGVIFFRPLNDKELVSVVRLQLQKFSRRLAKEKNIKVSFNESIVENIIQKGYNPIFGARSLNRYIEDEVESIVAKKIISGELKIGEKIEIGL